MKNFIKSLVFLFSASSFAQGFGFIPVYKCHVALKKYQEVVQVFLGLDDQNDIACREAFSECNNELLRKLSYGGHHTQHAGLLCQKLEQGHYREKTCSAVIRGQNGQIVERYEGREWEQAAACGEAQFLCKKDLRQRQRNGQNKKSYCEIEQAPVSTPPVLVAMMVSCEYRYNYSVYRNRRYYSESKAISAGANDLGFENAKARACSFAKDLCAQDSRRNNGGACVYSRTY